MKQTTPDEVTFETLPDLVQQEKTIVEEVEVAPDIQRKDDVQVTHSITEETGERLLKRIKKTKKSVPDVVFESIPEITKPQSIAEEVIEVVPEKDTEESVSVEIIETITDKTGKKIVKRVIKPTQIVPRDASFDTLRDIMYSQTDEAVDLKHPKKVTIRKKKPQDEFVEILETVDDKGKRKIVKKVIKKPTTEVVEGLMLESVHILEFTETDGTEMVQITKTASDETGKKVIKRVTKRKTSKEFKHQDITFDAFPQTLPEDTKSVEQIEVVPEMKEMDEIVSVEVTEQIIEESGKKVVKKIKMKQTTPDEVTFETLPELVQQEATIVEEVEVVPDIKKPDEVQVTHSMTEETGERLLRRIKKTKKSIPDVVF